jgi:hypothetical protein
VIKFIRSAAGRLFSPGIPLPSTDTTDRHDIVEILMKVALDIRTITLTTSVEIKRVSAKKHIRMVTLTSYKCYVLVSLNTR